jgi:transmembrane sensor
VREAAGAETRVIARLGDDRHLPTRRGWMTPALGVAAGLALLAGGSWLVRTADRPAEAPAPVEMAQYRTPRGQRLALRLSDGTQVMLAPGSVLRRPSDYGTRERRLQLEGQAYFIVTHDSTRPFLVTTRHLVARDLGTRFDVRAYPDEPADEVVVAEGKVAVAKDSAQPAALLGAGQLATVGAETSPRVRSGVDVSRLLAWTEGRLLFRDTPLREVRRQLERWYDVDLGLASADLGDLRVTGSFDDEPVTQVLGAVARSLGLVIRESGGGYLLVRPASAPSHSGES